MAAGFSLQAAPKMFSRMDTNGDANVTFEEYNAVFADQFKRIDKNRDGILSEKEFNHKAFTSADANKDGSVDADEYRSMRARQFKQLDTNGDGSLTVDEYDK